MRLKSFLALFLSAAMVAESLPAAPLAGIPSPAFSIPLPATLGYMTDAYSPHVMAGQKPDVILLQNLHVNRSVQFAISSILKHLKQQQLLPDQIAIEGATGAENISAMQAYPDAKVRKAAADYLVQQGEMPGAMHFAVTEGQGELYGVETADVYKANLEVYRRTYKQRLRLKEELDKLSSALPRLSRDPSLKEKAGILAKDVEAVTKLVNTQTVSNEIPAILSQVLGSVDRLKQVLPKEVGDQLLETLSAGTHFYAFALMRDEDMFKNTMALRRQANQQTTVLITGGFHTKGLTEQFKKAGLSYVVITPNVRTLSAIDEKLYVERLLDHHLTPEQISQGLDWAAMDQLEPIYRVAGGMWNAAVSFALTPFRLSASRAVTAGVVAAGLAVCPSCTKQQTPTTAEEPGSLSKNLTFGIFAGNWRTAPGPDWKAYYLDLDAAQMQQLNELASKSEEVRMTVIVRGEENKFAQIQLYPQDISDDGTSAGLLPKFSFGPDTTTKVYTLRPQEVRVRRIALQLGNVQGADIGNHGQPADGSIIEIHFAGVPKKGASVPGRGAFKLMANRAAHLILATVAAIGLLVSSALPVRAQQPVIRDQAQAPFSRQAPLTSQANTAGWARLISILDQELPRSEVARTVALLSGGIDRATDRTTGLVASHYGDSHLRTWGFYYDNMVTLNARLVMNQTQTVQRNLQWYRTTPAIKKSVFVDVNGTLQPSNQIATGHDVTKPDGVMVEAQVMNGPEVFRLLTELHAYELNNDKIHLNTAVTQARYLLSQQNMQRGAANYGGFRMGPKGNPTNTRDQKPGFDPGAVSWWDQYNSEHNNDIRRLLKLLKETIQRSNAPEFNSFIQTIDQSVAANNIWRAKMYDKDKHLFVLGSSDVGYTDHLLNMTFQAGQPQKRFPLDATALGMDDLEFLESLEPNAVAKIRQAIDDNFQVTVPFRRLDGTNVTMKIYGFMATSDRAQTLNWTGEGDAQPRELGLGRPAIGTFEWSGEVDANVDLYLASEYFIRGRMDLAEQYLRRYIAGVKEHEKGFAQTQPGVWEVPYATLFNAPTWTWLSAHAGPSVIGNSFTSLVHAAADMFQRFYGPFAIRVPTQVIQRFLAQAPTPQQNAQIVRTNSQQYLNWDGFNRGRAGNLQGYRDAIRDSELMFTEHPDWVQEGQRQNAALANQQRVGNGTPRQKADAAMAWWPTQRGQAGQQYQRVFDNWALNDGSAALFLRIEGYEKGLRNHALAVQGEVILLRDFSMGLVWDPQGWFWSPTISSENEMPAVYDDAMAQIQRGGRAAAPAAVPSPTPAPQPAPQAAAPAPQNQKASETIDGPFTPGGGTARDHWSFKDGQFQLANSRLKIHVRARPGTKVMVQLLPQNGSYGSETGLIKRILTVQQDGTVEVQASEAGLSARDLNSIKQISLKSGKQAYFHYEFGNDNENADIQSIEIIRAPGRAALVRPREILADVDMARLEGKVQSLQNMLNSAVGPQRRSVFGQLKTAQTELSRAQMSRQGLFDETNSPAAAAVPEETADQNGPVDANSSARSRVGESIQAVIQREFPNAPLVERFSTWLKTASIPTLPRSVILLGVLLSFSSIAGAAPIMPAYLQISPLKVRVLSATSALSPTEIAVVIILMVGALTLFMMASIARQGRGPQFIQGKKRGIVMMILGFLAAGISGDIYFIREPVQLRIESSVTMVPEPKNENENKDHVIAITNRFIKTGKDQFTVRAPFTLSPAAAPGTDVSLTNFDTLRLYVGNTKDYNGSLSVQVWLKSPTEKEARSTGKIGRVESIKAGAPAVIFFKDLGIYVGSLSNIDHIDIRASNPDELSIRDMHMEINNGASFKERAALSSETGLGTVAFIVKSTLGLVMTAFGLSQLLNRAAPKATVMTSGFSPASVQEFVLFAVIGTLFLMFERLRRTRQNAVEVTYLREELPQLPLTNAVTKYARAVLDYAPDWMRELAINHPILGQRFRDKNKEFGILAIVAAA